MAAGGATIVMSSGGPGGIIPSPLMPPASTLVPGSAYDAKGLVPVVVSTGHLAPLAPNDPTTLTNSLGQSFRYGGMHSDNTVHLQLAMNAVATLQVDMRIQLAQRDTALGEVKAALANKDTEIKSMSATLLKLQLDAANRNFLRLLADSNTAVKKVLPKSVKFDDLLADLKRYRKSGKEADDGRFTATVAAACQRLCAVQPHAALWRDGTIAAAALDLYAQSLNDRNDASHADRSETHVLVFRVLSVEILRRLRALPDSVVPSLPKPGPTAASAGAAAAAAAAAAAPAAAQASGKRKKKLTALQQWATGNLCDGLSELLSLVHSAGDAKAVTESVEKTAICTVLVRETINDLPVADEPSLCALFDSSDDLVAEVESEFNSKERQRGEKAFATELKKVREQLEAAQKAAQKTADAAKETAQKAEALQRAVDDAAAKQQKLDADKDKAAQKARRLQQRLGQHRPAQTQAQAAAPAKPESTGDVTTPATPASSASDASWEDAADASSPPLPAAGAAGAAAK